MAPARRVLFISQRQAELISAIPSAVLISIVDPGVPPPNLVNWRGPLLRVAFHDVDPLTFPGANQDLIPLSPAVAAHIARFVHAHADLPRLVVHCRSGVSRSAGVARAVAAFRGIYFPASYREYNRHVYEAVTHALNATNAA